MAVRNFNKDNHMQPGLSSPIEDWIAIVPDDNNDLPDGRCRAIYIGDISGGAAIEIVSQSGSPATIPGLIAGVIYPFSAVRVRAAGTTATQLFALY